MAQQRATRRVAGRSLAALTGAVLLALALVTTAAAEPCQPPSQLSYVAMGDSFSSGFGSLDASGSCNRSSGTSYPKKIQQTMGFGQFTDVSCSGARTTNFSSAQGSNPPQLNALNAGTDVVTFTIGGNDLGFTDILTGCATAGDCRNDYGGPTMPDLLAAIDGTVGNRIQAAITAARNAAPNAQIFVLSYPDLLPAGPTGLLWPVACLPTSAVISSNERTALRNVEAALNAEIAQRAAAVGARVTYVDVYGPSIGHDLCKLDGWTSVVNLYHPTTTGHREMGRIATAAIRARLDLLCLQSTTTTSTSTTSTTTTTSTTSTTVPASTTTTSTTEPGTTTTTSTPDGSTTTTSTSTTTTEPATTTTTTAPTTSTTTSTTVPASSTTTSTAPATTSTTVLPATTSTTSTSTTAAPVTTATTDPPQVAGAGASNGSGGTSGTGSGANGAAGTGSLPRTGSDPWALLVSGAVLFFGGTAVATAANRRRRSQPAG